MDFEAYLISKRIDSARFKSEEPELWQSWRDEFEQMHPNSFTVQKLYLINPIRRKYQLVVKETLKVAMPPIVKTAATPVAKTVMKVPRPGMPKAPTTETIEAATPTDSTESMDLPKPVPQDNTESGSAVPDNKEAVKTNETASTNEPANINKPDNTNETATGSPAQGSEAKPVSENTAPAAKPAKPAMPRPVMKPKPKTN